MAQERKGAELEDEETVQFSVYFPKSIVRRIEAAATRERRNRIQMLLVLTEESLPAHERTRQAAKA